MARRRADQPALRQMTLTLSLYYYVATATKFLPYVGTGFTELGIVGPAGFGNSVLAVGKFSSHELVGQVSCGARYAPMVFVSRPGAQVRGF
ncbi:MAG: hypothetical protein LBI61_00535 [Puniceicoccales bacterium]|nr:hypothetical protein [Puniceicoccales bacterium]